LSPTVVIREAGPAGCTLDARGVRDLAHVRRLLAQALVACGGEETVENAAVPVAKLHLLRGFLVTLGCGERPEARRLLLMALLQMEDEDEARRLAAPADTLSVLAGGR
jgi:hypothetical protein